jgi:WD40 repeat protein
LNGHSKRLLSIAFSHNGKYLVTTSIDGTAKIWVVKTGEKLFDLKGHIGAVTSAVFSLNDKYLFTTGQDTSVRKYLINY